MCIIGGTMAFRSQETKREQTDHSFMSPGEVLAALRQRPDNIRPDDTLVNAYVDELLLAIKKGEISFLTQSSSIGAPEISEQLLAFNRKFAEAYPLTAGLESNSMFNQRDVGARLRTLLVRAKNAHKGNEVISLEAAIRLLNSFRGNFAIYNPD